ncbi:MAG: hypothetical protein JSU66_16070 [Deltaproteobacteria bacterium]|nr:MAG: hypothetical protein JSU66_16070 [Deltaproteobacteria bacterium]
MRSWQLCVGHTWDGRPLAEGERVCLALRFRAGELRVDVDAPFHDDAPPPQPAGSCPGLFEFEVVELFLLGEAQRYLEVELGPHGHYLVLQLRGTRRVEASGLPLDYAVRRRGARWTGRARLPAAYLPPGLRACNAYAIHGPPERRRYRAAYPVPGPEPDFHRLEFFRPLGG